MLSVVLRMKLTGIPVVAIIIALFAGCEATSTCGDDFKPSGWREHRDTLGTRMNFDTISFDLQVLTFDMSLPSPVIRVFQDPMLTDSIRFELDLRTYTSSYTMTGFSQTMWVADTLIMNLNYSAVSIAPPIEKSFAGKKGNASDPLCSPVPEQTRLVAANVFIPAGTKATYIGR